MAPYKCHHCGKPFTLERAYMNHRCHQMDKADMLKTAVGQSAYAHYSAWMIKMRRRPPPIDTFATSSYFTQFIKFAEFCRDVGLPSPDKYVELMVDRKISPSLWTRNECYSIYLEWNDRQSTPYEQATISVDTILKIAEAAEKTPADAFKVLEPSEIVQFLIERKFTPWLLLCSKAFKEKLQVMSEDEQKQIMRLIGINYWATKLERNPEVVKEMQLIAKELGI
jgi:hypothetical protein